MHGFVFVRKGKSLSEIRKDKFSLEVRNLSVLLHLSIRFFHPVVFMSSFIRLDIIDSNIRFDS